MIRISNMDRYPLMMLVIIPVTLTNTVQAPYILYETIQSKVRYWNSTMDKKNQKQNE